MPMLANLSGGSAPEQARKVLLVNVVLNAGIAVAACVPLACFARLVMGAYGAAFEQGGDVLRMLAATGVVMTINNVVVQAITSKGRMWELFAFNVLWAALLFASTELLLRDGRGAYGLAEANLVAYAVVMACQGVYLRHVLGKRA
jgi:O-antigen/teichoic acid export membrane protein